KCRNCQRTGHLAEDCFRKGGGKEGQYPAWWKGKRDTSAAGNLSANVTLTGGVAELTQHYGMAVSMGDGIGDEIYADTGASDHFFKKREDFIEYTP
ncbi:hypothetical protein C8R42DRAFT_563854, partial [Lentinula raphanica]